MNYELEQNEDGSVQLRLSTPEGLVDLVFVDNDQFLSLVAGQHLPTARQVLNVREPTPGEIQWPKWKDSIVCSTMDCYAGKWRAEVMAMSPDIHDQPGIYVQFVEGCGYHPFTLTPEEALTLAEKMRQAALHSKKDFAHAHQGSQN